MFGYFYCSDSLTYTTCDWPHWILPQWPKLLDPNHSFCVTKTSLPSTSKCGSFPIHSWTPICSTFSFIIFSWFSFFLTKAQFSLLCRFVFNCNTVLSLVPPGFDFKRLFVSIDVLSLDDLTHILGVKIHLQIENLKNMSSVLISPQRLWWKKILWHLYLNVLKIFYTQHSKP